MLRNLSIGVANKQEASGSVQAEADPPFFFLAVGIVKLGQQTCIKKDRGCLLKRYAMVLRVSFGLCRIPLELILKLL